MTLTRLTKGKIALLITLSLTLAFIFVQSSLPPSVSGSEIDAVGSVVGGIFSNDSSFGAFLQRNISNIAHFCEYGALGVQITLGIFLWYNKKIRLTLLSVPLAISVGFIDESIQLLSGRHASIADIWIDVFGYSVFCFLTALVFTAITKGKRTGKAVFEDSNGKNNRC